MEDNFKEIERERERKEGGLIWLTRREKEKEIQEKHVERPKRCIKRIDDLKLRPPGCRGGPRSDSSS